MKESYCGLCDTCPLGNWDFMEALARVKHYANKLPQYWWAHCFPGEEGFSLPEFFKGLEWFLSQPECSGCKAGGGLGECPVRLCAKERQVARCSECPELETCERYNIIVQDFPGHKVYLHRYSLKMG